VKKQLIAGTVLAIAVPCSAAAATVTLYGVADVNISHFRDSDGNITSMNSGGLGGSRFGMKGVEKLREGLDAIFVLENGFNINDGTAAQGGRMFGRQAYVGLRSKDFGTFTAGRHHGLGYQLSGQYDPLILAPGSVMGSLTGETGRPWMYNPLAGSARMDNSIVYKAPDLNGFQLAYQHGFRADASNAATRTKSFDLASLTYAKGPVSLTYAFGRSTGTTYANADTNSQTEHFLGASYKFPWATLFGTYQIRKTTGYGTDSAWQIGARIPVGQNGKVHVAYGRSDNDTPWGKDDTVTDWGLRSWAVGYVYKLSKHTLLYAYFKQLDNRGDARQTIYPPGGLPAPSSLGEKVTAYGVGMRHSF